MKTTKSTTFVISAAVLIAAVMTITSAGSMSLENSQALAQEVPTSSEEKTISVTGTATTTVEPDLLVITFGVETQEITAKQALDANSQAMTGIIEAINLTGIVEDEINTSRFNIYPVYDGYEDPITKRWKQDLTGYRVTNTITVETTKLDLAADIIDGAVTAGANRVDNVSFTLSPEKHLQLKDELIEQAILHAKTKAENALAPLEYSIIGVKAVSLSEFGMTPPPMPMFNMAFDERMERSFASTPVFSSDQDVSTTANVVFLIGSN
ncbi:MAG: SIMPL domain-containing protein [Nitrosopumilus sp.]|nr:SIMPL domain-containing protein [Nitrosopumilus sp.]MDH3489257.1 SIMPL domain-containing protein [Nitrosopumilus sp.]MDH3516256.1 SIMPL domain-containing protein [Nitrosopumilus sp.]MDH3564021.1 SIMPL domain-containing protein [Nitrosopumilus sp.]MDH5417571.1 SIMPL domain-containing protein [Nitrosopumilus sp.]